MGVGPGHVVGERYVLSVALGHGGMGSVWRAFDTLLERDVALKEVRVPAGAEDSEAELFYRRTLREARAAVRLRHPSIVTVVDVVTCEGRPWIVMELIPGRTLEDLIAEQSRLPAIRTVQIAVPLLGALQHAHRSGVIHRDVKPSNVMLAEDGRVVLTDFGIATFEGAGALTRTGVFLGSPNYTAPELVRGGQATPASDLWSLGATLYTMLEGRAPYEGPSPMATMAAVLTDEPPPPRQAGRLEPLVLALLAKDPAARPSGDQVADRLAEIERAESRRPLTERAESRRPLSVRPGETRRPATPRDVRPAEVRGGGEAGAWETSSDGLVVLGPARLNPGEARPSGPLRSDPNTVAESDDFGRGWVWLLFAACFVVGCVGALAVWGFVLR